MIDPAERYRQYLETLTPETLSELSEYVSENVRFKDPFNDVRGLDAMTAVLQDMFENVDGIRFRVARIAGDTEGCLMTWHFEGTLGGKPWAFEGSSAIRFTADGRVSEHIDYWDAAGALYERLPVIGWLLSRLRRRLASH